MAPATDDVIAQLDALREEVECCSSCVLAETRTKAVFGEGDPGADLLFVDNLCSLPLNLEAATVTRDVLADHRGVGGDSRTWGPVKRSAIQASALLKYWPPQEFGGL